MSFNIRILGANSAVPNKDRFPSSQCVTIGQHKLIIDCGEGVQINLSTYKIKRSKINHILISHLHGDHVYGLPGLLSSLNLSGRTSAMILIGPQGIKDFIEAILSQTHVTLHYPLTIKELDHDTGKKQVVAGSTFEIFAFPLKHRIPTYGYIIKEKHDRQNIKSDQIEKYNLTVDQIKDIKKGESFQTDTGIVIPNEDLLTKREARSYAYCSDTIYDPSIVPHISGVDLLYHEATYLHELKEKADQHKHSTAQEAGQIAQMANVKRLIIGHYSSRYDDLQVLETEAKLEFENSSIVHQGDEFNIE